MNKIIYLEKELIFLGLLDKAREVFLEMGEDAALSYLKSSYHLLSKVYHPDLNPQNRNKANDVQLRLNKLSELIEAVPDYELVNLLKNGKKEKISRKRKILVVEDEFGLQDTLQEVFLMEGYDVKVAVDGEDGYKIYSSFKPDLVFTDVVMPKMNGTELVQKIRKENPKIKVVFISGFFGLKDLKRELNRDVLRYGYHCLPKPFKISTMLELVEAYLNGTNEVNYYA